MPTVTATPHPWQDGMLRADGQVIYQGTHNLPATCGDALRIATAAVNLHEGDDHVTRADVQKLVTEAIAAHQRNCHMPATWDRPAAKVD
jgi:hypothetical protein